MIRQRLVVVVAVLAAVAAGTLGTFHSAGAATVTKYVFAPNPIAAAGSLTPTSPAVTITVTADAVTTPQVGATVWLAFNPVGLAPSGAFGGSATATDATHVSPVTFNLGSGGIRD